MLNTDQREMESKHVDFTSLTFMFYKLCIGMKQFRWSKYLLHFLININMKK